MWMTWFQCNGIACFFDWPLPMNICYIIICFKCSHENCTENLHREILVRNGLYPIWYMIIKIIIEHSKPSIVDVQMIERFAYVNLSKYRPRSLHISLDAISPELIDSALSISTSYVKSLYRVFNWTNRMKSQKSKLEEPLLRRITFRHSRITSNDVFEFKVENSKIADFRDILIRAPKHYM